MAPTAPVVAPVVGRMATQFAVNGAFILLAGGVIKDLLEQASQAAAQNGQACKPEDPNNNPGSGRLKNPPVSPLIVDLNGDGVKTISLTDTGVYFDLDKDGFAQRTAWVSPQDGLLALDRNANGRIDDIGELFGLLAEVSGLDGRSAA
jgi:hypothetical protein